MKPEYRIPTAVIFFSIFLVFIFCSGLYKENKDLKNRLETIKAMATIRNYNYSELLDDIIEECNYKEQKE